MVTLKVMPSVVSMSIVMSFAALGIDHENLATSPRHDVVQNPLICAEELALGAEPGLPIAAFPIFVERPHHVDGLLAFTKLARKGVVHAVSLVGYRDTACHERRPSE